MKKRKYKKQIVLLCMIAVTGIILIIILNPYYKLENRVKQIKDFSNKNNNPNPLGWLRVQGTNIDFPIIYYYDVEDVGNPTYDLGWSFEENRKLVNRTVILSHNVLNVSNKPLIANKDQARFEQLMSYIYYDFVKKNKYIEYTINHKNYLFKIYGVSLQLEEDLSLDNLKKNQMTSYIDMTKQKSYFDFSVDVNENDQLITLVTCTRFFGNNKYSFVVDARKVRKNELIKNYQVKENKSYSKVKKILKGDDKNE